MAYTGVLKHYVGGGCLFTIFPTTVYKKYESCNFYSDKHDSDSQAYIPLFHLLNFFYDFFCCVFLFDTYFRPLVTCNIFHNRINLNEIFSIEF